MSEWNVITLIKTKEEMKFIPQRFGKIQFYSNLYYNILPSWGGFKWVMRNNNTEIQVKKQWHLNYMDVGSINRIAE